MIRSYCTLLGAAVTNSLLCTQCVGLLRTLQVRLVDGDPALCDCVSSSQVEQFRIQDNKFCDTHCLWTRECVRRDVM